jgi:molybdopterin/thiamine biosynthesis adenylyltransferase
MTVELLRLASLTTDIVDGLAWSAISDQCQTFDFWFCIGATRVAARLAVGKHFPSEMPTIHLLDASLNQLAHVGRSGDLCYTDIEGLSASLRDPTVVVVRVLHDAHRVLAASLAATNQEDVLDELASYWDLRCKAPAVHVAVEAGDRVKTLEVWTKGRDIIVMTDRAHGRCRFGQHTPLARARSVGLYLPIPGHGFDRSFINALADGQVPIKALASRLDAQCRTMLAAKLKRNRRFEYIVFGVAVREGERAVIGAALAPVRGREFLFTSTTAPGSEGWTPLALTRIDRGALLPRGGVRGGGTNAHVMVIGCGALGGHVATAIARIGLRRLTLVDPENLAVENIYRHALGFADVGRSKAEALADLLNAAIPHLKVDAQKQRGEQLPDVLFDKIDLVLVTVGTPTVHRVLNARLHRHRCRVVFGWLEPLGIGGHALLTGAAEGGCLECLFLEPDGRERLTAWSDFAAPGQSFALRHAGCTGSFTPFADLDARRTANLVVELGLEALAMREGPGRLRSWQGPTGNFIEAGYELSEYRKRGQQIDEFRQTRCPVCGGWPCRV